MIGRPLRIQWHEDDTSTALKEAYLSQRDVSVRTPLHGLWLIRSGWQIKAAAGSSGCSLPQRTEMGGVVQGRRSGRGGIPQDGRSGSAALSELRPGGETG